MSHQNGAQMCPCFGEGSQVPTDFQKHLRFLKDKERASSCPHSWSKNKGIVAIRGRDEEWGVGFKCSWLGV